MILPYGRQSINDEDVAAVCDVLRSDFLTSGPKVEEFERRFATRVGGKHAIAMSSATAALHAAMSVTKLGPGDRVVTSPNTFVASANAAAYVGATPDFVDIDPVTYTLDPDVLSEHWQKDIKAIVAVDYAGQNADLIAIAEVARRKGALIIDDASHAVGGAFTHADRVWRLGGNPWADLTVFSFHPVKTMTAGEGGMLVTENDEWARHARRFRSHGIERTNFSGLGTQSDAGLSEKGTWYYEMHELGYNYRLTDIQCALGLSQLDRLQGFIDRRRAIVAKYNAAFSDCEWLTKPGVRNEGDRAHISWHLYTVQLNFSLLKKTRTEVMKELKAAGIGSQVLYIPVHLQPWYRERFGYGVGKCPVAEEFYSGALSLPLYPAMTNADVQMVIDNVNAIAA